jgi:ribosome-binding factor A
VLRFIPELTFELDDSIEHGARMLNLIDQALLQDGTDES